MKKVKVYLVKVLHYSRPIQRNNSTVISVRDIFTLDQKDSLLYYRCTVCI